MTEDEEPESFRWFQCSICGKLVDSESTQLQHEKRCRDREREVLLYSSAVAHSLEAEEPWNV
ncbi:MAG: DUF7128 family protein [Terriglobia bacterium]